jgi:hypothetical protein
MSYTLQNFYKSTLALDWTIGTGNFYVAVAPTQSTGWLVISPNNSTIREIIKYTATGTDSNGPYVTVSVRGVGGTTEQIHTQGEPIRMNITAEYWDAMNDDIAAIVASGVTNANTTTMGGVEIATPAEVDAGTATGGTGASLALTPDNVNTAHNIPFVVPSTAGNIMNSNGTDWQSSPIASLLPTPFFQQDLALSANDSLSTGEFTAGSMTDGSAFFLRVQGNGKLYRFQKDTATGLYYETHSITPTLTCTDNGAIINIGSYIYMFTHTGTNVTLSSRFLAADLTGEQVMTVPSVVQTGTCGVWSDGASAYVVSNSSQTTSRKWTVSGTTFTEASTATVTTATFAENQNSTMWDGTTAYMARMDMASPSIYKLTSIDGSSFSTTTRIKPIYSDVQYGSFIINIDTTKMYIGFMYPEYDEAGVISCRLYLIPVTKP